MSTDNGIYILPCDGVKGTEYRVAEVFAISLDYYQKPGREQQLEDYIEERWGRSPYFSDLSTAKKYAESMMKDLPFVEYGIVVLPKI